MRLLRIFLLSLLLIPVVAVAQDHDAHQSGEIIFEPDEQKSQGYATMQDSAIQFITEVQQKAEKAAVGTVPASIAAPDSNTIVFLNSAYMYCTINKGVCPAILDAMLEADMINSKLENKAQCPILKSFWKLWVRSDMEKRLTYSVQTGYLADTEAFKKNERPKYIRCEETIQKAIEGTSANAEFFKSRYSGDSAPAKELALAVKILAEIKARVPNVMAAVGAR